MPKKVGEMKALDVGRLTAVGFHAVGGVAGLHLRVSATGARSWILRKVIGTKRRDIGLGGFPDVTLADARAKARVFREKIEDGIDPVEERRARKAGARAVLTFDESARRLIDAKAPEWSNAKHRAQWESTLATYASPLIGRMDIAKIDLPDIVNVLAPIWTSKTETATRVRSRVEAVLSWAIASGFRSGSNPARWRGNLDAVMPKPGKVSKVRHFAALPYAAVPAFLVNLRSREGIAARAVEFLIYTAARSGEVRGARWSEIDLDAAVWMVPAERMKSGREHRVPLTSEALSVLQSLPRFAGDDLVFVAPRGGQLSDMTLTAVLRRMEISETVHGFRSAFRDYCAEQTAFPGEIAEAALAHVNGDKTEAAYRRSDFFDKRRLLMETWARYCATPVPSAAVVPIKRASARKSSGTRR